MAYQGQKGLNPVGLGVAIAINGGLLALAMLTATTVVTFVDPYKPMEAVNIPIEPPPPPIDEPRPVERAMPDPAPVPLPYVPPAPIPAPGPVIASTDTMPTTLPPLMPTPPMPGATGTGSAVTVTPPLPVLVNASVDPRYRADFQPDYPAFERNQGRNGVVVVRVLVGANGRVAAIEPVSATSDAFLDATKRRALSKWRFRPATRDGVAIESWREMTVRFNMEDN
ncbi:TonB family protein [Sphingomonas sp. 2R-10]|uniref:TonB family protein n=1 Tax=Sphingomonas sp. 2R-10 TaxID=3045148 RepID=UPI000F79CFBD|nr:TonB family protein [Sphingomonas sp. 2R-10]MDJ0278140.1 TonB family protein [Sphingomonas sp. 2R-10]